MCFICLLCIYIKLQQQAFSGQSPPYSLRPPQKPGAQTPEKQQQQNSQAEVGMVCALVNVLDLSTMKHSGILFANLSLKICTSVCAYIFVSLQHVTFTGQTSPFSWLPQKLGAQTPEKAPLLTTQLEASPKLETRSSSSSSLLLSSDKQSQEHVALSPERRDSEQSSAPLSEPNSAQQSPQHAGHAQSLQQQSLSTQHSLMKQQQQVGMLLRIYLIQKRNMESC